MKLALITEGGKNIGLGHICRCLSLCPDLKKKGIEICFIINNDVSATGKVKKFFFKIYKSGKDNAAEILTLITDYDCVIVDSYKLDRNAYLKIQRAVGLLVCIDDNKRIDYPPGIVINGALYAKDLNYPRSKDIVYMLGPKFITIRQEFIKTGYRIIKENINNVLIMFGGDDSKKLIVKVRDFVLTRLPKVRIDIITGSIFRYRQEFKNSKDERVFYHYHLEARDIVRLMQSADIAISAGGQTLYELAKTGTPTVGICVSDNQVNNLESLSRCGFLQYCGWYNSPNLFEKLKLAIINLQDKSTREKMSKIGQSLVDGRGAERIAKRIYENIK